MNKVSFAGMVALLVGAGALVTNCSQEPTADVQDLGVARFAVTLAGGAVLNAISYSVTGNGVTRNGTLDVSHSSTISALVPLPAGGPYTLSLNGTTVDGLTMCSGMATFSVAAHQTTQVSVGMLCRESTRTGSVLVTGAINVCPVVDGIGAAPSEVTVGATIMLAASAHDTDNAPAGLSYAWSAPSGTLSNATVVAPTFTCTQAGPVTISLTVTDGDTTPGCAETQILNVTCSPAP